jgi:hypothetical protein
MRMPPAIGAGFDPAATDATDCGLGSTGIAEWARILADKATVRASPGQGTSIIVELGKNRV